MTNVYLKLVKGQWEEVEKSDFWIDRALYVKLKNLKKIQSKQWDGVILIDGKERSGKSDLGMVCGWFLSNGTLSEKNFCRGLEDASKRIALAKDGDVIIMDEGSTVASSKESSGKAQRALIQIFDVVGQKNLIFIFCQPSFFDLNKTIAVRRSLFLLHVYPDEEYNRGQYAYWGEDKKKELYITGKKNFDSYAWPRAEFVGQFMKFEPPFYQEYIEKIKKESLQQVLKNAGMVEKVDIRHRNLQLKVAGRLRDRYNFTQENISYVLGIEKSNISRILQEFDQQEAYKKAEDERLTALADL